MPDAMPERKFEVKTTMREDGTQVAEIIFLDEVEADIGSKEEKKKPSKKSISSNQPE